MKHAFSPTYTHTEWEICPGNVLPFLEKISRQCDIFRPICDLSDCRSRCCPTLLESLFQRNRKLDKLSLIPHGFRRAGHEAGTWLHLPGRDGTTPRCRGVAGRHNSHCGIGARNLCLSYKNCLMPSFRP